MESLAGFQLGSFIIQAINLLVIVWVLRKFVFKPYLAYVVEQEKKQKQIDEASDTIARTREQAEKEANKVISEANAQAFELRTNAKTVASDQASQIVAEAEQQATSTRKQAEKDALSVKRNVEEELQTHALKLAMSVNKKLFKGRAEANSDFIQSHIGS